MDLCKNYLLILADHIKDEISLFVAQKKELGAKIGKHWKRYKKCGSTFILMQFTLPAIVICTLRRLSRSYLLGVESYSCRDLTSYGRYVHLNI